MTDDRSKGKEQMVKVVIRLAEPAGNIAIESLWAAKIADSEYELRNSPWWVYGLNWGDVVTGQEWPNGRVDYGGLIRRGGHRTLRVSFDRDTDDERRQRVLKMINKHGASYEHARGSLYAVDVPADADYESIFAELIAFAEIKALIFEVGSDGTDAPLVAD